MHWISSGTSHFWNLYKSCLLIFEDDLLKIEKIMLSARTNQKSFFFQNGFTPLHIAAKKNQHHICTLLFGRGCEADMTTRHGVSPLHLAAKEGNVEIVDTLLEHGALPSLQTTVRVVLINCYNWATEKCRLNR